MQHRVHLQEDRNRVGRLQGTREADCLVNEAGERLPDTAIAHVEVALLRAAKGQRERAAYASVNCRGQQGVLLARKLMPGSCGFVNLLRHPGKGGFQFAPRLLRKAAALRVCRAGVRDGDVLEVNVGSRCGVQEVLPLSKALQGEREAFMRGAGSPHGQLQALEGVASKTACPTHPRRWWDVQWQGVARRADAERARRYLPQAVALPRREALANGAQQARELLLGCVVALGGRLRQQRAREPPTRLRASARRRPSGARRRGTERAARTAAKGAPIARPRWPRWDADLRLARPLAARKRRG